MRSHSWTMPDPGGGIVLRVDGRPGGTSLPRWECGACGCTMFSDAEPGSMHGLITYSAHGHPDQPTRRSADCDEELARKVLES